MQIYISIKNIFRIKLKNNSYFCYVKKSDYAIFSIK